MILKAILYIYFLILNRDIMGRWICLHVCFCCFFLSYIISQFTFRTQLLRLLSFTVLEFDRGKRVKMTLKATYRQRKKSPIYKMSIHIESKIQFYARFWLIFFSVLLSWVLFQFDWRRLLCAQKCSFSVPFRRVFCIQYTHWNHPSTNSWVFFFQFRSIY